MIEYYKNFSLESLFYINEKGLVCQEEWRDVPNFEGFYQVSDLGRIKSSGKRHSNNGNIYLKQPFVLKQITYNKKYNYLCVNLSKNRKSTRFQLHKIVAMAFLEHIPDGTNKIVVDHKNTIGNDNKLSNLQLLSNRKNISKDAKNKTGHNNIFKTGKMFRVCATLNNKRLNFGSYEDLETALSVRDKILRLIEKNKDISRFVKDKENAIMPKRKIKEKDYVKIKDLYSSGLSSTKIASEYNVNKSTICKILKT